MKRSHFDWPDNFPDNCPPIDCESNLITVYRLVSSLSFTSDDFLQTVQESPHLEETISRDNKNYLQIFGLSVILDMKQFCKDYQIAPNLKKIVRKKPYVSKGDTRDGLHKQTPSKMNNSHATLWLKKEAQPHTYFEKAVSVETYDG